MPRKPRMYLPGIPSHVIQRGNNRLPCFFAETDYSYYLYCLREATAKYRVAVHAYVLTTNHVHLLMTPTNSTGISSVMQSIGRRYVQYVNYSQLLQPHPLYLQLHNETEKRLECYRGLFTTDLGSREIHTIRKTINFSMPLGNDRFKEEIEQTLGRRIGHPKRGRPFRKNRDHHDDF